MAAYMLVYAAISDRQAFQSYADAMGPIFEQFGAKLLARADPPAIFEGDWPWETAGIVEFESAAVAKAMWESDAYRKVRELRRDIARFQVVVV